MLKSCHLFLHQQHHWDTSGGNTARKMTTDWEYQLKKTQDSDPTGH